MTPVDAPQTSHNSCGSPRPKSSFVIFTAGLVVGLLVGLFGGAVLLPILETKFGYGAGPVTIETVRTRRAATQAEQAERQKALAPAPPDSAPAGQTNAPSKTPEPAPQPGDAPRN